MSDGETGERSLSIPLAPHGGESFPAGVNTEPSRHRYVGFYENQCGEQLDLRSREG